MPLRRHRLAVWSSVLIETCLVLCASTALLWIYAKISAIPADAKHESAPSTLHAVFSELVESVSYLIRSLPATRRSQPNLQEYFRQRDAMAEKERRMMSDYSEWVELTDKERRLDTWLNDLRQTENEELVRANTFPPSMHFYDAQSIMEASRVYKLIRTMPKGAVLHAHFDALAPLPWLIGTATYLPECHLRPSSNGPFFQFRFFPPLEPSPPATPPWTPCMRARASHSRGPDDFDALLLANVTVMTAARPGRRRACDAHIWLHFANAFASVNGLLLYEPVFRRYVHEALRTLVEDHVCYAELRIVYHSRIYNLDGEEYSLLRLVDIFSEEAAAFRAANAAAVSRAAASSDPSSAITTFNGAKLILCAVRHDDVETVRSAARDAVDLMRSRPDVVVGFDIVGYEEAGHSLRHYADALLNAQEYADSIGVPLAYVFHAGETITSGTAADANLYDALLLRTRRIGHALSLEKHPHLMAILSPPPPSSRDCNLSPASRAAAPRNATSEHESHAHTQRHPHASRVVWSRFARGHTHPVDRSLPPVALELCPVSNHVLGFSPDMRTHPIGTYIHAGIPVTISPDDPALFAYEGASPDWYMVFAAFESVRIATMKSMARASLVHSLLPDHHAAAALARWDVEWGTWVEHVGHAHGLW